MRHFPVKGNHDPNTLLMLVKILQWKLSFVRCWPIKFMRQIYPGELKIALNFKNTTNLRD